MQWMISHEGPKAAVKAAVDAFVLQASVPALPTPAPGVAVTLDADPVPPPADAVAAVDYVRTTLIALIDKLPPEQNGVFVYAAGEDGKITTLRVEGRAFTL